MNEGVLLGISSPPIIRGRFDPIFANRDFKMQANGFEPENDALQRFFDEAAGRKAVFESSQMVIVHTVPLYIRSGSRIEGNGATIQAHPGADINCTGIHLTDATWAGLGPANVRISDLTYRGRAATRRAAGLFTMGQAAGFYLINCDDTILTGCRAFDCPGDGFYMGGDSGILLTTNSHFDKCFAQLNARNGLSVVGTNDVTITSCIWRDHTYGNSIGNFSCGIDCEPNGASTRNFNVNVIGCIADTNATAGFNASNNTFNNRVNWISPISVNNNVGYFASAAGGTSIAAARYSNNITNFSGIAESINTPAAAYPGA